MENKVFESYEVAGITFGNRILRSATDESIIRQSLRRLPIAADIALVGKNMM